MVASPENGLASAGNEAVHSPIQRPLDEWTLGYKGLLFLFARGPGKEQRYLNDLRQGRKRVGGCVCNDGPSPLLTAV